MKYGILFMCIYLMSATGAWCSEPLKEKPVLLLTAQEAALEEEKIFGFSSSLPNDGPIIKIVQPTLDRDLHNPFRLTVQFIPRGGREVNLGSLKVEALKIINLDITSRLLPYAKKDGIKMDNVEIPSGRHNIRITIQDMSGRTTQEVFRVNVL